MFYRSAEISDPVTIFQSLDVSSVFCSAAWCSALTSIRQTPAVCVFAQQAAECVPVFVQVDVRGADSHHLLRTRQKLRIRRQLFFYFAPMDEVQKSYHVGPIHR